MRKKIQRAPPRGDASCGGFQNEPALAPRLAPSTTPPGNDNARVSPGWTRAHLPTTRWIFTFVRWGRAEIRQRGNNSSPQIVPANWTQLVCSLVSWQDRRRVQPYSGYCLFLTIFWKISTNMNIFTHVKLQQLKVVISNYLNFLLLYRPS